MDSNPCSSGILKRNPNNINNIEIELIYLIAKYLSVGPCKKSFEVLRAEIEENRILPRRIDWHGNEHEITFNDYDAQNGHIAHDYLLQVVSRLEPTIQKLWPTFPEQKWGLLGRGSQSLLRSENDAVKVYKTLSDVLVRQNGNLLVEPSTVKGIPNATQSIIAREICGTTRRKHFLTNKFYSRLHLFVRNVGHLSAIYCMLFDRCGRYIITGADDMLVKIWSVIDGRLVATLRGASAEISDLALDQENTLLAAGSCDKIIRVWSLQNLAPIAVLSSHTGMITALQFCPAPNRDGVLVSTGGDGCVAFWSYTRNKMDVKFNPKPLKLNERVRPGHAQLICASFSTGGNFLAVGGADHFVRVYKIGGPDGMEKLIETEIHTDRVDSIQWRHCGIEFVSGSRDGTALIWRYQSQQWRTTTLNMNQLLPGFTLPEEDSKKLQVTMVGWDRTDKLVITASSDHLLRVWDSRTGELKRILEGHEDNAYVIEAHPTDDRLILTAGHDGLLFIWDVIAGVAVKSFKNTIEGQGHGALFDAKWAPDGLSIATTDSHGHILIFGMGQNELFKKIPQELFFHTDYRPLVRDINHHVLDEQTQLAPHLMPPPFLVNIDGDPYPPELQRLVPGRENCRVDQLIPNVVTNDNGEQEVLDLAIADVEHHLPAPIGQPPGRPPDEVRLDLLGGGRRNIDEMIERLAQEQEERRGVSDRNRDELPGPSNAGSSERRSSSSGGPHPDHSYAVAAAPNALSPRAGRVGSRREGDIEGVRQSTGNWQRDPHMKWKRQMFVSRLSISALEQSKQFRLTNKDLELALYNEEIKKGPDTPQTKRSDGDEGEREGRRNRRRQRKTHAYSTRANRGTTPRSRRGTGPGRRSGQSGAHSRVPRAQIAFGADFEDPDAVIASQDRQQQEEEEEAALSSSSSSSSSSSIAKEALEEEESSDEDSDNSTDYSDWTADVVGAGLEPPKRTAHKQKTNPVAARKRKRRAAKKDDGAEREESEDEDDDEEEEMRNNKKVKEEKEEAGERRIRRKRRRRGEREEEEEETNEENEKKRPSNARRKRDARNLNMAESDMEVDEIPPEFRLPDWLGETVPKKAPYFPQMGDEIMYFRQGHQLYVEAVLSRQLYQIDKRSLPWIRKHNLRDQEYVKIIGIKYEIKPPRLCCLKLGIMDMDGVLTGDSFTIKYHDMPDVLDFLVLKNTYDTAVRRNWKSGDRFRCIIDDAWWIGTVETQEPHLPEFPDSMFMCYRVLWDNGERERLSPWDMEPIDDYMELPDAGGSVQVSPEEYKNLVYTPSPEEWEAPSFEAECQRMGEGIGKIMELAAAEPFLAPVDLNVYPNYAMVVAYPMDLSTIKSRLESHFYRRPNAVQFDVRYIATNAEKFNKKGSVIVRNARIITELALRLIKDPSCRDPTLYYHEAQANYQSPSHSEDEERKRMRPDSDDERTRRRTRGREIPLPQGDGTIVLPKSTQDNRPWQQQCRDLLKSMFERQDSIPFRFPVDLSRFEDYSQVIDVPMDLSTIREELAAGAYASPLDFAKDVRLVFQNSKNYNTNNKSRIYSMTVRLEAFFEDQIKGIFARCKNKGKGKGSLQKGPRKPRGTSQAPSGEKPDNRTIMPPRLSLRTTTTASVEQLKKSEIGLAAGPSGSCKTLSEVQINGVSVGASDISDDDDGDEALRGSVNEGGKRRSRRVARLRQLQDDDDDSDDEEYSPIKKNTQKSPRESRQTLGGRAVTGRSIPVAGTDKREKGGPVKRTASRKINFHDDDSDSGTTSKRSSPLLNSRSKRIRLVESSKASSGSSEISSEDESEDNAKPTTSSILDESHRPTRAPVKKYIKSESSSSEEEPPVDAVDSIKNALTSHFAKKRRIDSSDTENSLMNGTKEEEEEEGEAVKGDDDEDEEGEDEEDDDEEEAENKIKTENQQINEEEEEESRHEIKNDGDNDEEENDDDDNEDDNDDDDDEEGDNDVAENEEAEDEEEEEEEEKEKEKTKTTTVNSLHRQRLTLASFGKRKKEEESDFEFDEEELEEESEEEEEDEEKDRKRKSGGRGRKRPSRGRIVMRRSRRRALHGDEDFDDDDDDDFVADDFIDDGDAFSSSSSSSDSEDESSDAGGRRKSRKKKKISLKEKEKRKQQAKRERQKKAKALARKKAKEAKAKAKAKEKAMKARQKAREREKIKKAKEAAKKNLVAVKLGRGTENTNPSISFESRISISAKMSSQIPQVSTTNLQQTSIPQNQRQSPCHSQIKQTSVHPSIMHQSPIRSPVRSQIPIPNVAQQLQQIPVSPHAQVASHYRQGSVNAQLHQAPVSAQFHQVPISPQIPQNSVNPQIHQAPIATQYHQASIGTQIHQAPGNAQIHQAPPLNAQIHQVSPLNAQIHHTPVSAHIHQTPPAPAQIHHVPVSVQMHSVPVNTQIQKNHMNPVSVSTPVHQTTLTPQIHGTTTIQQSYVVPISNAYSVTQYVPITPNPHQTGQSGNLHQTSPTYHSSLQTQQQIAPPTVSNLQMAPKFGSPPRTEHSRPIIVGGRLIGTHITRIEAVSDSSASESDCDADEKVAASTNGSWNGMRTRRGRIEESEEDEVGKTGRIRKRVRYNEDSEEGELSNSVSSRGRVRKANTRMRDFI